MAFSRRLLAWLLPVPIFCQSVKTKYVVMSSADVGSNDDMKQEKNNTGSLARDYFTPAFSTSEKIVSFW